MTKSILVFFAVALGLIGCRNDDPPPVPRTSSAPRTAVTTTAPVKDLKRAKVEIVVDPAIPATFVESTAIGNKPGADGTVAGELTTFKASEPVYITMRFKLSPVGLQSRVRIFNSAKKQVGDEFKEMNGAKVVTFRLPPLKAGHYKVSGYWGGNLACEYAVVVK